MKMIVTVTKVEAGIVLKYTMKLNLIKHLNFQSHPKRFKNFLINSTSQNISDE